MTSTCLLLFIFWECLSGSSSPSLMTSQRYHLSKITLEATSQNGEKKRCTENPAVWLILILLLSNCKVWGRSSRMWQKWIWKLLSYLLEKVSNMPTFPSSVPKAKQPSLVGCQANYKQNRKKLMLDTLFLYYEQKENIEADKEAPSLIPILQTIQPFDLTPLSITDSALWAIVGMRWNGLKWFKYCSTSPLQSKSRRYCSTVRKLLVGTRSTTTF